MDNDGGRKLQDDSKCQSFGINHHPCSQPRKISIGVVVDSVAKCKSMSGNADRKGYCIDDRNSRDIATNLAKGNQGEPSLHDKSAWISTRSRSIHHVEQSSNLPAIHEIRNISAGTKITPGASSVQFLDDQNSKFLSNKAKEKGGNDSAAESAGKFLFAVAQEDMQMKASTGDKTERADIKGSESLRMRLREILETVSSPKKLRSNSEVLDIDAKGSHTERVVAENHILKASLDTIENDSQSHNPMVSRPLTRKRAPSKLQRGKSNKIVAPCAQEKRLEKKIFYFGEGRAKRSFDAATGGSLTKHESLTKRKSSEIEAHEISVDLDADKNQEQNPKCNKVSSVERSTGNTQSHGTSTSVSLELRVDTSEKDLYKSPVVGKTEQLRDINRLKLRENLYHSEDLANSSLKENFEPKCDVQHPTFPTKTPLERHFLGSLQRTVSEYPPPLKQKSLIGEDNHVKLSQSPSDDRYSESSEDGVHVKGCRKSPSLSPEIGTAEKPNFAFKPGKVVFNEKGSTKFRGSILNQGTPKELEDSGSLLRQSEQSEEDGFDRAVALFGFALQRVKTKMKSMADKRSAEILKSAAEGIHKELQTAEIQILADLRTVTSKSKANQKHLEAILQEQQEQLDAIYVRFKEQVNQHLQDCRITLEHLEEHESELKATVEKQSMSRSCMIA
nr:meiosis-specific protein ASY3 isoform X1 [Ipomoea batatas]